MSDKTGKSGPLTSKIGGPWTGRARARKSMEVLYNDLQTEISLTSGNRDELLKIVQQHQAELRKHGQNSSAKKGAIKASKNAEADIRKRIAATSGVRGKAIEVVLAARDKAEKEVFGDLAEQLREAGATPDDIQELAEFHDLTAEAMKSVWAATDKKVAERLAVDYAKQAIKLANNAKQELQTLLNKLEQVKSRQETLKSIGMSLAEANRLLDEVELSTGSANAVDGLRKTCSEIYSKYVRSGSEALTTGKQEAEELLSQVRDLSRNAEESTDQALRPLQERLTDLKTRSDRLAQDKVSVPKYLEDSGFEIELPFMGLVTYWPQVEAKFDLADRAIADKLPASGISYLEGLLDEIEKMLDAIESFDLSQADALVEAMTSLDGLTKRHKAKFFDTTLQTYCPKDANILRMQYKNIETDCKLMKPAEIVTHVDNLVKAAETAQENAKRLKDFCKKAAEELKDAKKEVSKLNAQVRISLPDGGHKTFHGAYRRKVEELEAALAFKNGPDENKIDAILKSLPILLEQLKPAGKIDPEELKRQQTQALTEEEEAEQEKESVKAKLKDLLRLYDKVAGRVETADPGDTNALDSIKRQLDEAKSTVKKMPPDQATIQLAPIESRLRKLDADPRGAAVRARGKLGEDEKDFNNSLDGVLNGLRDIVVKIDDAYDGDKGPDAAQLVEMAVTALQQPKQRIAQTVQVFVDKSDPGPGEQGRRKAREMALGAIRDYRKILTDNAALAKLMENDPFTNGKVEDFSNALNQLELNVLRGI